MLSGWIWKTLVVLGAAALGVEYGRRHPDDPWRDLIRLLKQRAIDTKENLRARQAKGRAEDNQPAAPAPAGPPADSTSYDTTGPAPGPDLGPLS